MRSKVHIRSHPLHPILVGFPITFFISTLFFDAAGLWRKDQSFLQTAYYLHLLAILSAIAAAIPGLIDYLNVVPPKSSAKKRATQHALLNSTALVIFIGAWVEKNAHDPGITLLIVFEFLAVGLMGFGGWLGGTLVHRNQIGIDHRYADAGKWQEKHFDGSQDLVQVASADDLKVNQMMLIQANGKRIVLGRTENEFVAFDDFCTHRGASLADGVMICGTVQCPWHGSQFDCKTGAIKAGPAKEPVKIYPVTLKENSIFIDASHAK
ncbi:MAG TPA: DUF2231 domain-containing protein [Flavitalea sp.]|nr:DUF2231 domain-containing protein [Flavitalea sp.]